MRNAIDHGFIFLTIFFTVYSQSVIRWQVSLAGAPPGSLDGKLLFVFELFFNPWVLSGLLSTFLAGVSWMLVLTRFEMSYAYPWVAINFPLILLSGIFWFGESISLGKVIGTLLIFVGIVLIARG